MKTNEWFNEYLSQSDWRVKENSNKPFSLGGLNSYVVGKASALKWAEIYNKENPEIIEGHNRGDYHIHDLGSYSSYCFGASLNDLLLEGIHGIKNISVSKPAKRLRSICSQIANIATIFQNDNAGAIAFSSWNVYLAPFVYFDTLNRRKLSSDKYEEIEYDENDIEDITQSIQNLIFALNSNSRQGSEPVFSNFTLDFHVLKPMQDRNVIIGGKEIEGFTYKDFQKESELLIKIFSEIMFEGDGVGKPFAYPIPTFNIGKNMDWDNPNFQIVFKLASKTGAPYFGNFVQGVLNEEDVFSMCPLTGDTEVYTRSCKGVTIQKINIVVSNLKKGKDIEVLTPNGWSKAIPRKMCMTKVFRIHLSNGCFVDMGENHLQPVKDLGTLSAKDLQVGMWLPAKKDVNHISSILGSKELGFVVGAYIGDGSHDEGALVFSLDAREKDNETESRIVKFFNSVGFGTSVTIESDKSLRTVRVNGNAYALISLFVSGDNVFTKSISKKVYAMSLKFIEGLFEGFEATDGSRSKKRFYTSSLTLKRQIQQICNYFGIKSLSTYKDSRDNRYSNRPNYRIDLPERGNYGDFFKSDDSFNYYSITNIEEIETEDRFLYCFEVEDDSHLFLLGSGIYTHNCRLRLDKRELQKRGGGLFGASEKTGSVAVFTVNLPAIAYRNKGDKESFERELEHLIQIGGQQMEIKRRVLEQELKNGLFPSLSVYLKSFKTLFSTIGLVGGHEMCLNFLGKGIETKEGRDFTLEVLHFMREKIQDLQVKYPNTMFNLEYTPAESTSYRLALKDKKRYPDIITAGKNEPYYTNSVHLPVGIKWSFKKIYEHQNGLLSLATGGSVYHNYINGSTTTASVKHFLKQAFSNYDLPYISFSPVYSVCPEHGFISGKHKKCPQCDKETEIYQRVTGYIRPISSFNNGKLEEFEERYQNSID